MEIIEYQEVEKKIIQIRGEKVIVDSDVAELYGVETKIVNQAVSRNLDKFPEGYILELNTLEKNKLVTNCDRLINLKYSTVLPKAFTERGLYMLATILKSSKATKTTLAIIEAFVKTREISRTIIDIVNEPEDGGRSKSLSNRVGQLIGELIMPNETELETISVETSTKLKFLSMIEVTRTIIKKSKE